VAQRDATQGLEGKTAQSTSSRSIAADRILKELHAINYCYLQLLAQAQSDRTLPPEPNQIPETLAKSLAPLSPHALEIAARCPYSLFDLAFDDVERWQRICERPASVLGHTGGTRGAFVSTVLFFSWHLTNAGESRVHASSRLLLGMPLRTALLLQQVSLSRLGDIAQAAAPMMQPRWSTHPRFWPDLVRSVSKPDPGGLQAVRLLGRQLLAAEAMQGSRSPQQSVNTRTAWK